LTSCTPILRLSAFPETKYPSPAIIVPSSTNRALQDSTLLMPFAQENLKHIMHAKKVLGKRITDSLN
jgi:hypothetical protein